MALKERKPTPKEIAKAAHEQTRTAREDAERRYATAYAQRREQARDLIGITLNNRDVIEHIESYLRGVQLVTSRDKHTGRLIEKWEAVADPIMEDKAVGDLVSWVAGFIGKNIILSAYQNESEINETMALISEALHDWFAENIPRYKIDSRRVPDAITKILLLIEASFRRALYAEERKVAYGTFQTHEHRHLSDIRASGEDGFFSKINPFRSK